MARVRVQNVTRGSTIARRAELADTRLRRLLGLMGRRRWTESDGLLVRPCSAIHTYFMRVPIDVVFASRDGIVLDVVPGRRPWRVGPVVWRAAWALELRIGAIDLSGTRLDDRLAVEPAASHDPPRT